MAEGRAIADGPRVGSESLLVMNISSCWASLSIDNMVEALMPDRLSPPEKGLIYREISVHSHLNPCSHFS